jgi:hypothetical protein
VLINGTSRCVCGGLCRSACLGLCASLRPSSALSHRRYDPRPWLAQDNSCCRSLALSPPPNLAATGQPDSRHSYERNRTRRALACFAGGRVCALAERSRIRSDMAA